MCSNILLTQALTNYEIGSHHMPIHSNNTDYQKYIYFN